MEKIIKRKVRIWPIVLVIVFLIMILVGMFFYFALAEPSEPSKKIENPVSGITNEEALAGFNKSYIDYLIYAMGGWKLHNPPLSTNTPKIKVKVEGAIYLSEIVNGGILTRKGDGEADMVVTTTKQEVVNTVMSEDMENYIKESIQTGQTQIKLNAGYSELFAKGYLSIHKDLTGESLTASVVEMVS